MEELTQNEKIKIVHNEAIKIYNKDKRTEYDWIHLEICMEFLRNNKNPLYKNIRDIFIEEIMDNGSDENNSATGSIRYTALA